MTIARLVLLSVALAGVLARPASAQDAPSEPPPTTWRGAVGAGLAMTSGNADTSNFNLAFDLTRDAREQHVLSWRGRYLRGSSEGVTNVDRTTLAFKDEYEYSDRTFLFGQIEYFRDAFKQIDYLISTTAGVGYDVYESGGTRLSTDAGVGVVWEKNATLDVRTDAALSANERFELELSENAAVTQSISALWTLDDFADGLYTVTAGLTTSITARTQLTIDVVDTFKSRPPNPMVKKNDLAIVTAVSWTFGRAPAAP